MISWGELDLSELQTVSVTIGILTACISVVIGVVNSILASRREERQRQTSLFMGLYNRFNDIDFSKQYTTLRWLDYDWTTYDEFTQKYSARVNFDVFNAMASLGRYLEGVGVLVEKGLIDIDLVTTLFSQYVTWYWEKHESMFQEYRRRYHDPVAWDHVEYLYNEVQKRRQQAAVHV